jgi:hypothetical protein
MICEWLSRQAVKHCLLWIDDLVELWLEIWTKIFIKCFKIQNQSASTWNKAMSIFHSHRTTQRWPLGIMSLCCKWIQQDLIAFVWEFTKGAVGSVADLTTAETGNFSWTSGFEPNTHCVYEHSVSLLHQQRLWEKPNLIRLINLKHTTNTINFWLWDTKFEPDAQQKTQFDFRHLQKAKYSCMLLC